MLTVLHQNSGNKINLKTLALCWIQLKNSHGNCQHIRAAQKGEDKVWKCLSHSENQTNGVVFKLIWPSSPVVKWKVVANRHPVYQEPPTRAPEPSLLTYVTVLVLPDYISLSWLFIFFTWIKIQIWVLEKLWRQLALDMFAELHS